MITIENKKTYRGKGIYIGREMPGQPGSVLGNPFKIGRDGTREEALVKYRRWLWEQINLKNEVYLELRRIAQLAAHGDIVLLCWCAPNPCHADIVKRAVDWVDSAESAAHTSTS